MKPWLLTAALLGAASPAFLPAPARAQDKAEKTIVDVVQVVEGGKPKDRPGKVESADWDKVAITDLKGKRGEVPAADVLNIRWGDAPGSYEDGVRALDNQDGAGAQRAFSDVLREKDVNPNLRDWIVEYANAGLGRAHLLAGQPDKAVEAFAKARSANAKSVLTDRILLGLAEAELARGKGDAAARAADDLIAAAKTAKRPAWELEAYLVKARGKLSTGDHAGAIAAFDEAVRFAEANAKAEKNPEAKKRLDRAGVEAAVRKGWVLVAKGDATKSASDYDAARSYFDSLASRHGGEPMVLASASNAAGVARFAAGDAVGALRQFMATEVVHFRAADEVARALWWQAECWRKLGKADVAADRVRQLKEDFPGSEWARRAQ